MEPCPKSVNQHPQTPLIPDQNPITADISRGLVNLADDFDKQIRISDAATYDIGTADLLKRIDGRVCREARNFTARNSLGGTRAKSTKIRNV